MKKIILLYLVPLATAFLSCQNLEEMNENPNRSGQTHPKLLLTQVEWSAFSAGVDVSPQYAQKMLVQTDGESSYQYYKWNRGDFRYASLRNVAKMMEEAERVGEKGYVAIGHFFRANYFYQMTLMFGDIPYSEALKGETNDVYQPAYDTQKTVMDGVLQELATADELLRTATGTIDGDIIYGGDTDRWRRLVNAFRLKVLLTLSRRADDADLDVRATFARIYAEEPIMRDGTDDAQLVYLDQEGNRYPEFNSSGFGSGMYMDSTFIRRLQDHQDPRLFLFCTQTKEAKEAGKAIDDFTAYEGGNPVAPYATVNEKATRGKVSKVLERYHQDPTNEPSTLLGYAEQELILAEAAVRGWITADADEHYRNGVKASFKFYETYAKNLGAYVNEAAAGAYLALPANDLASQPDTDARLACILSQKYFRSFFQGSWAALFENMRTGLPEFMRPAGVEIPFRWMYPQSEYNYNASHVSEAISRQFGEGNDRIDRKTWWLK